ncbi:unnamed protein product [Mytilus edulis]|uniref:Uncharacterized protein n=1 Tax=Mytilus edulis TaxID=6550 RepID=A0A8S3TEH0_MYTED|nr:unnamed protein product [Mytilus edulis]
MEQDEYDDIFLYLKETKYVDGKNDSEKRILRRKAKNFLLGSHDNLYYIKDSRKKQVVTKERLRSVLRLCHVDCGSHFGRDKTYHKVKERYVLTCVDYTSKWPEAFPIYSKSTAEVGSKLYSTIADHSLDWDQHIEKCLFNYRTSYHHSTKFTPFYVMYLRQAVLPNETLDNYVENVGDEAVENSDENIISNLEVVRQEVGEKLKQNVDKAQKRQKEAYDRRHNVDTKSYEIGQYVLLKIFRRKAGMATTEQRKYIGPYKIIQYKGKGNFVLWNNEQSKTVGPHNQKNFKLWISNPESENDNTGDNEQDDQTGDDQTGNSTQQDDQTGDDQTGNSTQQDEEDVDCEDAGAENKDDSVFLTQNTFMEENDETTDDNAVASNFNLSQSSINSESEVERQVERKSRKERKRKRRDSSIYEYR